MAYQPPKLSALIATAHANIQSKLMGTKTSLKNSVLGAIAYCQAALAAGLYHFLTWIYKQIVPHLADDEEFIAHAKECGIFRKPASIAKGTVKVFADQDVTIPKNTRLQRTDGTLYQVSEDAFGKGELIVKVESIEAGIDQNVKQGDILSFINPILYVQNVAEVIDITGGSNIEPMSEMRDRYIFFCQYPPQGGSQFDYVRWARDNAGVSRAWCFPRVYGGNTVGVAWVYDAREDILPTSTDIATVLDYMDHHIDPVTNQYVGHSAGAEVIHIPITLKPINPVIQIFPDSEDIRENVRIGLENAINAVANPSGSIPRSHLTQAISNAVGEYDHRLIYPTEEIQTIQSDHMALLVLGEIEWR